MMKNAKRKRPGPNACPEDHQILRLLRFGSRLLHADHVIEDEEWEGLAAEYRMPATIDIRYKSVRVARMFEDKNRPGHSTELEKLLSLPSKYGRRLGWSHLVELLQVPTAVKRQRFAKRVVKDGLRADALRQLIREQQGRRGSRRPRSGRPRREPLSVWHAIDTAQQDLAALTKTIQWLAGSDEWPKSGKMRKSLVEIQAQLESLRGALKALTAPA
jgi:hypothetical protein